MHVYIRQTNIIGYVSNWTGTASKKKTTPHLACSLQKHISVSTPSCCHYTWFTVSMDLYWLGMISGATAKVIQHDKQVPAEQLHQQEIPKLGCALPYTTTFLLLGQTWEDFWQVSAPHIFLGPGMIQQRPDLASSAWFSSCKAKQSSSKTLVWILGS